VIPDRVLDERDSAASPINGCGEGLRSRSERPLVHRIGISDIEEVGAGHRIMLSEFERSIANPRPRVRDASAVLDNHFFDGAKCPREELDIGTDVVRMQVRRHAAEMMAKGF